MKHFLLLVLLCSALLTQAQGSRSDRKGKAKENKYPTIYDVDTLINPIPKKRELFAYYVDVEQKKIDAYDGVVDGQVVIEHDDLYSKLLTDALLTNVDKIQIIIENLPYPDTSTFYANNQKINFYQSLAGLVKRYNTDSRKDPVYYKKRVDNFKGLLIAQHQGTLPAFFASNNNIYTYDNIDILMGSEPELRKALLLQLGVDEPMKMLSRFTQFADEPYSGDVLATAARLAPNQIYNYASSGTGNRYSIAIRRSTDPVIQTIVKITDQSKKPLAVLPFLEDINAGKMTIAEADKIVADQDLYFKNLVRLKLQSAEMGSRTLTDELQYRINNRYVRRINELHEEPDAVRFRILDGLSPEELYFIMVYGQDEIYTSSFVGANKRMLERMGSMTGDELLDKVHYDKFRTFIRMSAGYNTLNAFLATMSEDHRVQLMNDFVDKLEDGRDDDLEDAVDVADAYGSINDSTLSADIKDKVTAGYERSVRKRSAKGMKVYALLASIFDGNEAALDLPPIRNVPYSKLIAVDSEVVERVFFYGDEDGRSSYASFMNNFRDGKWKIESTKYWTKITATAGKPVVIYANLPLPEPQDEEAQNTLDKFLTKENIEPTIIIHRGHSYHLPITLDRLNDEVRVVILGSCGGYHNLANVLDASPEAHIVSSKQTGAMAVNDPIIRSINGALLAGKDIDWVASWKQLDVYFSKQPVATQKLFSDYIPPYKNLGAIFIKAYRRLSAQENAQ